MANEEKKSRKKLIITLVIIIGLILVSYAIYFIGKSIFNYTNYNPITTSILNSSPNNKYENEIKEYLKEKYDEDFVVTYHSKRQKPEYTGCIFGIKIGEYEDIVEYVYSYSLKEDPKVNYYVCCAEDTNKGTQTIYELSEADTPFITIVGFDEKKEEVSNFTYYRKKKALEEPLKMYLGYNYDVNIYSNTSTIKITCNYSLENMVRFRYKELENQYKFIENLLSGDLRVSLEFSDKSLFIKPGSRIEDDEDIKEIKEKYGIK